ncbi:MAG: glycosyltransferase, partial [Candidatus Pacebacteria bacterium]|nr:glycosyltransferase [Candidatus Paceibacterota bacterium]
YPSFYEGFGFPPFEAMAAGTPVITSNFSSLPEAVGDAAITVDPYNIDELAKAIEMVLSDEKLRGILIERGYERVKNFSWEKCAEETLEFILR